MSVLWQKVLREIYKNRTRTMLVILSTAVGVFALGLVFSLSEILNYQMSRDYRASNPAHINFWGEGFSQELVNTILREPSISAAEGETIVQFRWKLQGESDWRKGNLIAREDYKDQQINKIDLVNGKWPARRNLALERQSAIFLGIPINETIIVEFGRGERYLPVEGIVRSPTTFPPQFGGYASFYATPETIAWLVGLQEFNQLNILLEDYSEAKANLTAELVKDRMDRMRLEFGGYTISDPDEHWMKETVDTLTLILLVLGFLSLAVGAFLIVNTMNAIIAQQVWQIGVMKVIGATSQDLIRMFLMSTLIYGVLATFLAVPASAFAAYILAGWLLDLINISFNWFYVVPNALVIQILVGLFVPLLASLGPVLKASKISPHQAISTHGLGIGFGFGTLDRLLGKIRNIPSTIALGLRNSMRRKTRIILTLLTLILAGVMFIVVMSVGTSLDNTLEVLISNLGLDVWVVFREPQSAEFLIDVAETVPGVLRAEVWDQQKAALSIPNGQKREIYLMGLPSDSEIFNPQISSGRSILPEDNQAILLNRKIAADEGINVGDQVELKIGQKESIWTVVGLILDVSEEQSNCYVSLDDLGEETGNLNRGSIVMVISEFKGVKIEHILMDALQDAYLDRGIKPNFLMSATEVRLQSKTQFNIIVYLMLAMAVMAALVGCIGLMGTMFINVFERRREIGVMRSVGATSFKILEIIVVEGVFIGLVSWIIAVPISYPGAQVFSDLIGKTLILAPLSFQYSIGGIVLWLGIVILLSTAASIWPAMRAVNITVSETLAYE